MIDIFVCAPVDKMSAQLISEYNEPISWIAKTKDGDVVTMHQNAETGTWTIVVTRNGLSCVVDAGSDGTLIQRP